MKIEIHRVTGLEHKFRSEPGLMVSDPYNVHKLFITTQDGHRIELVLFSEPDSTPVWPTESRS